MRSCEPSGAVAAYPNHAAAVGLQLAALLVPYASATSMQFAIFIAATTEGFASSAGSTRVHTASAKLLVVVPPV